MQNNISEPSRGISYKFLKTDRFKTTVISMGFYLPIDGGAAANSLALSLMRSGTSALPDPYSFQRKLASLTEQPSRHGRQSRATRQNTG